jgi:predicted metal-dependent hydrolase
MKRYFVLVSILFITTIPIAKAVDTSLIDQYRLARNQVQKLKTESAAAEGEALAAQKSYFQKTASLINGQLVDLDQTLAVIPDLENDQKSLLESSKNLQVNLANLQKNSESAANVSEFTPLFQQLKKIWQKDRVELFKRTRQLINKRQDQMIVEQETKFNDLAVKIEELKKSKKDTTKLTADLNDIKIIFQQLIDFSSKQSSVKITDETSLATALSAAQENWLKAAKIPETLTSMDTDIKRLQATSKD